MFWGFKHGQGDEFLGDIKIRSTSSFGGKEKPEAPCRKIFYHVENRLGNMYQNTSQGKIRDFLG
jgi:hypothetical protein